MKRITDITRYVKHDDPVNAIDDIQQIVRKEIREKIFGTVRQGRWKEQLDLDACVTASILHLVKHGELAKICDLNDRIIELAHEHYDKFLGESLIDDLLTMSVKDIVRQEVVKIWWGIGPKPGEKRKWQSKKQSKESGK